MIKSKKVIIVTGGLGFIGSNYLNEYVPKYKDYFFINVDCVTYAADPKNVSISEAENYAFEKVDIRDIKKLEEVFEKYKPTDIIHFAAESHVDVSIEQPAIFVETNVVGTHNLLLLAKRFNIKRFQQVSTDEVYGALGKNDPVFTVNSPIAPNSPYSASKAAAEMLVMAYHKTFELDVVITRCTNNYGPNADETKMLPKFITLLLEGRKIPLYGKGDNIRDWIYVQDHVEALDLVFHKGENGKIYHVGAHREVSNFDMVRKLLELTDRDESFIEFVPDRKGHDFRYALDTSETEKELGWSAKTKLEDGLRKTVAFYRNKLK